MSVWFSCVGTKDEVNQEDQSKDLRGLKRSAKQEDKYKHKNTSFVKAIKASLIFMLAFQGSNSQKL